MKMKSLREELQSQKTQQSELIDVLNTMAAAADGQVRNARDLADDPNLGMGDGRGSPDVIRGHIMREVADLELFIEMAARQRDKMADGQSVHGRDDHSTLEPLIGLANAISRSVTGELEMVQSKVQAVNDGREQADDQMRAGMEKRRPF